MRFLPLSTDPRIGRVAIVGTGLIGGSIGLAVKHRGLARHVVGYDISAARANRAVEIGALDSAAASAAEAVDGADLVFIATPVGSVVDAFSEISKALGKDAIVTDVGSTKATIVTAIESSVPSGASFIGGHPLAGSEREGVDAADGDLYEGAFWILTPTPATEPGAYKRLVQTLTGMGARVISLEPHRHDEAVALSSHLPQLISSTLMAFADEAATSTDGLPILAAGGFRDMTRIAASPPELWVDIVKGNRVALLDVLTRFTTALTAAGRQLSEEDWEGLRSALSAAREARLGLPDKPGLAVSELVELVVPIPDRPGALAEVTTTLGEAGVNIEDIDIVHSPEGGKGTIHMAVRGPRAWNDALDALTKKGISVYPLNPDTTKT